MKSCEVEQTSCGDAPLLANLCLVYTALAYANAGIVIAKELFEPFKEVVSAVGHHWLGHGVLLMVLLIAGGYTARKLRLAERLQLGPACALRIAVISTVLGVVILFAFYLSPH